MRIFAKAVFILCMLLISTSCKKREDVSPNLTQPANQTSAIKLESMTYIPINLSGMPGKNVGVILNAISQFEKNNPKLEIKCFQIEYALDTHSSYEKTNGVWIYHQKRTE